MAARRLLDRQLPARQVHLHRVERLADALGQVARSASTSLSASTIARSMVFSSSRTLPGQRVLEQELARLGRRRRGCCVPRRALLRAMKWSMSRFTSSRRLRSGGMWIEQHVDAVEEVLAEAARLHVGGEVAVRRGDDAHVDLDVLRVAEAPDVLLLQHAQELHLQVERQLADLVEEERAAVGLLEEAAPVGDGVGERALLVAEELATRAGSPGWRRS